MEPKPLLADEWACLPLAGVSLVVRRSVISPVWVLRMVSRGRLGSAGCGGPRVAMSALNIQKRREGGPTDTNRPNGSTRNPVPVKTDHVSTTRTRWVEAS